MSTEHDRQVADRDRAVQACVFAVDNTLIDNPAVRALPGADQTRITLEAALGYLIGHGLVEVKPQDEWPEWLAVDMPDHMRVDVEARVRAAAERRAAMFG